MRNHQQAVSLCISPGGIRLGMMILLVLVLASCATNPEEAKKISISDSTLLEHGKDVEMLYSRQGVLKSKILAGEVIKRQTEGEQLTEFLNGIKLYFYDENMTATSQLSANYGLHTPAKEEVLVRDNVVIVNNKGEMLNTEELLWKRKEEKIFSDKFVRITTPDEIIFGTGFEAKQDFSDYVIRNITGTIQVKDEPDRKKS